MSTASVGRRIQSISQGRFGLIVGLIVAAFVLFFPARQLVHQDDQITYLERRLDAVSESNRRLEEDIRRLEDPAELEALARDRLGLVRPGEDAYHFIDDGTDASVQKTRETNAKSSSFFSRAWSWFTGLIRGRG